MASSPTTLSTLPSDSSINTLQVDVFHHSASFSEMKRQVCLPFLQNTPKPEVPLTPHFA